MRHCLLCPQLLRPDGEQSRLHPPPGLRPAAPVPPVHSSASPRRQAHGLRQHAAAVRDDVRPAWQGPAPHRPQAQPRATLDPLLLCKVCIYSPLGLQRGWGAGQMVCSPDKEDGGGEAEGGAPTGHSGGRPAQPWGGGAQRLPRPPYLHGPSPAKAIGPRHRKTPGRRVVREASPAPPSWQPQGGARLGRTPFPSYFMSVIKHVKIKSLL